LVGEQGTVAQQRGEVVLVEGRAFQPFDRTDEQQLPGNGFAVGSKLTLMLLTFRLPTLMSVTSEAMTGRPAQGSVHPVPKPDES
jgi:hypothetical protein